MKRLILTALALLGMAAPALADTIITYRVIQWNGRQWVEIGRYYETVSTPAPQIVAPAYTPSPACYYRQPTRLCETGA